MKLITAIVNKEDSKNVCNELIKAKFYVTRHQKAAGGGQLGGGIAFPRQRGLNGIAVVLIDNGEDHFHSHASSLSRKSGFSPGTAALCGIRLLYGIFLGDTRVV